MVKAAVVLSGCGYLDGSEIHEAVSVLIHLSRVGASVHCFAPDIAQASVVNHATGKPAHGTRNVLEESARIARGKISPLDRLRAGDFDAVFFPGGFVAAKNLCDFASSGAACTVHPDVERVIREFHAAGKPVGLCCIAPVLAAKVLGKGSGGVGCAVTLGNDPGVAGAVAAMGSRHENRPVTEACTDHANQVVTSPAYMYDATPAQVFQGIGAMVDSVLEMAGKRRAAPVHVAG